MILGRNENRREGPTGRTLDQAIKEDMLRWILHHNIAGDDNLPDSAMAARTHYGKKNNRAQKARRDAIATTEATEADLQEREAAAQRLATELIEQEEAEKRAQAAQLERQTKSGPSTRRSKANPDLDRSARKPKPPGRSGKGASDRCLAADSPAEPVQRGMALPLAPGGPGRRPTDAEMELEAAVSADRGDLLALVAMHCVQASETTVTEEGWKSAKARPKAAGAAGAAGRGGDRAAAARRLLATWKTTPCSDAGPHDWRLCAHHHPGGRDARRDPLAVRYLPGDALNKVEEVYHPINFRSRLCGRPAACPFREPYVCAFAHAEADLLGMAEAEYLALFGPEPERPLASLGDYLPPVVGSEPGRAPAGTGTLGWGAGAVGPAAVRGPAARFLPLTEFHDHLVTTSGRLWRQLTDSAGLYLCRIERHRPGPGETAGLLVTGEEAEADMVVDTLRETLARPPEDLVSRDSEAFSERVVARVGEALARQGSGAFGLGPRDGVLVEADRAAGRIVVQALRTRERPALGREVLGQIRFWLRQEGLDQFVDCAACGDRINPDQGVACLGGHSFCARAGDGEASCVAGLIRSQLASIRAQEGVLVCPVCRAGFSEQRVAALAPAESWAAVQQAALDARVERRYAELQSEFDRRLQQKVQELVERFDRGDVSELVSQQGAAGAAEARNSALNLACPSCHAAYADFDGCMALQCASCSKHFCGYCHKPAATSRGCHDHVRECDMNLTPNGSYYADPDIIREAQRRYRVKKLKHFLRSGEYKKDVQNSIVFHLTRDLKDLGVDPAALFDVGNLQGAEQ